MTRARDLSNAGPAFANVNATELGYLDGVSSAVQTQINAISPSQSGNSGKYLTTNGSAASWGTVATGSMTYLGSVAASGTSVNISGFSQSYSHLLIKAKEVGVSNVGNMALLMRMNGISASATYAYWLNNANASSTSYAVTGITNNNTTRVSAMIYIYNYSDTGTNLKNISSVASYRGPASAGFIAGGGMVGTTANAYQGVSNITSITFIDQNGYNFNTGTFEIYGVN